MTRLSTTPIVVEDVMRSVRSDRDGAVALFVGTVRSESGARRVVRLEYEAYAEMAEAELSRIERESAARAGATTVAIVHRVGTVSTGEVSVVVAAAAAHRGPALDACRLAIEAVKATVKIWKKEIYEDGAAWIEGRESAPES